MTDEAKKARNNYRKEWRKKNPEKVKAYEERRWERLAAKLATQESPVPQHEKEEPTE